MARETYLADAETYIKKWLETLFPLLNVPGLSVAIAHKGQPFFAQAWGVAHNETGEKLTPSHLFRYASHSKTFTAVLAFLLAEKNLVKLEEPLDTYLPWIAKNKDFAKLTLRHVLTHTTGAERDGDRSDFWNYKGDFPTREELQAYFTKAKPVIESNTRFKYSNYAYGLAGLVLEAATGKSYDELARTYIFKPLGLKQIGTDNPAENTKLCTGHSRIMDGVRIPLDPYLAADSLACVTGFHGTPTELVKAFSAFILKDGFLSRASQKEFMRPQWPINTDPDNKVWYSYGLDKEIMGKHHTYGHGGGYPGFITQTYVAPESEIAVSVAFNALGVDMALSLVRSILDIVDHFKKRGKAPLKKYEGRYFSLWSTMDVIAANDKLLAVFPNSALPFNGMRELVPVKGHMFRIRDANGFGSPEEDATFVMKNGKPTQLVYGSSTMVADEKSYKSAMKKLRYVPKKK